MLFKKDEKTIELDNEVQKTAFVNSGWIAVEQSIAAPTAEIKKPAKKITKKESAL